MSSGQFERGWKPCMLCRLSENICPPGTTQPNYEGKKQIFTSEVIEVCVKHTDMSPNQQDQCFYQLRTIQQLGYAVFCHNRVNEGVGSFEVSLSLNLMKHYLVHHQSLLYCRWWYRAKNMNRKMCWNESIASWSPLMLM